MSLRIVCTVCHSASEVDTAAAGGQAICPYCSEQFDVPETVSVARRDASNEELATQKGGTIEKSLATAEVAARPESTGARNQPMEWGQIDPRLCCQLAAMIYAGNAGRLLMAHCFVFGLMLLVESLAISLPAGMGDATEPVVSAFARLLALGTLLFMNVGLTKFALQVARGGTPSLQVLWTGGRQFLRFGIFNALYMILVLLGSIGFVVPGVYFATRFWAGGMFVIDKDTKVMEGFGWSSRFSDGNRMPAMMLGIISLSLAIFGASLFGVGLLLVYPWITMIWVVAYLMLSRQEIQLPPGFAVEMT